MKIDQIYDKSIAHITKGDKIWAYVIKNYADSVLLDIAGNQVEAKIAGNIERLSGWVHIKLVSLNPPSFEIIPAAQSSGNIDLPILPISLDKSEKSVAMQLKRWFNPSNSIIKAIVELIGGSSGKTFSDDLARILHFYDHANHTQKDKIDQILSFYTKQQTTIGNAITYQFPLVLNNKNGNGSIFLKTDGKRLDIVVNIKLDSLDRVKLIFSDRLKNLTVLIMLSRRFKRFFPIWNKNIYKLLSDYPKAIDVKFRELKNDDKDNHNIEYWA